MPKRVKRVNPQDAAMAKSMALLLAYAQGQYVHLNRGQCPDPYQGFASRDPDCVVCQAVNVVSEALKVPKA